MEAVQELSSSERRIVSQTDVRSWLEKRGIICSPSTEEDSPNPLEAADTTACTNGRLIRWRKDAPNGDEIGWSTIIGSFGGHVDTWATDHGWTLDGLPAATDELDDLILGRSGFDLVEFVESALAASPRFDRVRYGGLKVYDLTARDLERQIDLAIEVKRIGVGNVRHVLAMEAQRPTIESDFPNARLVLAIAGTPTIHARKLASELKIEIWDRDTLLSITPPSVIELYRAAIRRETAADRMEKITLRA